MEKVNVVQKFSDLKESVLVIRMSFACIKAYRKFARLWACPANQLGARNYNLHKIWVCPNCMQKIYQCTRCTYYYSAGITRNRNKQPAIDFFSVFISIYMFLYINAYLNFLYVLLKNLFHADMFILIFLRLPC